LELNPSASPFFSLDWLIFLSVGSVWLVLYFLFKSQKNELRRKKSREIAEKAVAAGEPYRNAERVEVEAASVPGLSQDELKRLTDEIVRLGFVRVLDYRLRPAGRTNLTGFGRTLVNRQSFCFAEVMATQRSLEGREPFLLGLDTYLEEGWRISSINRKPHKVDYLARLPKSLRIMLPEVTPEELFARHLELSNHVARDLGLQTLTDLSLEMRFQKIAEHFLERKETLLGCDILGELADARSVTAESGWEWLGDYPQEKARRMKGQRLLSIPGTFPVYKVPQQDAFERLAEPRDDRSKNEPRG
jgi:hypothetical protein